MSSPRVLGLAAVIVAAALLVLVGSWAFLYGIGPFQPPYVPDPGGRSAYVNLAIPVLFAAVTAGATVWYTVLTRRILAANREAVAQMRQQLAAMQGQRDVMRLQLEEMQAQRRDGLRPAVMMDAYEAPGGFDALHLWAWNVGVGPALDVRIRVELGAGAAPEDGLLHEGLRREVHLAGLKAAESKPPPEPRLQHSLYPGGLPASRLPNGAEAFLVARYKDVFGRSWATRVRLRWRTDGSGRGVADVVHEEITLESEAVPDTSAQLPQMQTTSSAV